jgi:hypothetical protein
MTESARDEALRLAREVGIGSPVPGSQNAWVLIPDELVRLIALARQPLRDALEKIEAWQLPEATAFDWTEVNAGRATEARTYSCSYETAHGSNGARLYIQEIARDALAATPKPGEGK